MSTWQIGLSPYPEDPKYVVWRGRSVYGYAETEDRAEELREEAEEACP